MPNIVMPGRIRRAPEKKTPRTCPAHRAWVRKHRCCVLGCTRLPVECAHVRQGTDGGVGLKPSDRWVISLCSHHHAEQHRIGESRFAQRYDLDLIALACEFARRSPYWQHLVPQ